MKLGYFCFFLCLSITAMGQTKMIDSLTAVLSTEISDSTRTKVYSDLCWYYGNVSLDSAFHYGKLALNLSEKTKNANGEAQAYNDLGILYYKQSEFKTSISLYKKSLLIRQRLLDSIGMASLYNKLGLSYQRVFKLDSALFYNMEALKLFEFQKNTRYVALIKNNMANIYSNLKQYDNALKTHLEVALFREEIKDNLGLTHSYTNIGNTYLYLGDTLNSKEYYNKGIVLAEQYEYENEMATLYNNVGGILKNQNDFATAESLFLKSLKMREERSDNYGVASVLLNLGELYLASNQVQKAEAPLRRGLELSQRANALELQINSYRGLLSFYAYKKNTDSILKYQTLHAQFQDTLFRQTLNKEITDIQEKYNAVQQINEISQQKELIVQNELKLKNRNLINYLLLFGLVLLGVVIFGLFKRQKHKRQEHIQELLLKEMQSNNKLQEQRLRISRDLHDNIGSQLTFIISSLSNLSFLSQNSNKKLKSKLTEITGFATETISQFRDTIWAMNSDEILLEDFQGRILSFIEKAKTMTTGIQFSIESDIDRQIVLSSTEGINLFRVVQEAINNAVKYGKPTQIRVTLNNSTNKFKISISDNGSGFTISETGEGNGLKNMKKRIEEINGKIKVSSTKETGTEIKLSLNK